MTCRAATREIVSAGSEGQSHTLQAEPAACLRILLRALLCKMHLHCAMVRGVSIPQKLLLVLNAYSGGIWGECPAKLLQCGEMVPSSKTPLGNCPPNTGVVCDVLGPAEDVSDISALSQAAGK